MTTITPEDIQIGQDAEAKYHIYHHHDGVTEWVATALLSLNSELICLTGGVQDEIVWDRMEAAIASGDDAHIISDDGERYSYEQC